MCISKKILTYFWGVRIRLTQRELVQYECVFKVWEFKVATIKNLITTKNIPYITSLCIVHKYSALMFCIL